MFCIKNENRSLQLPLHVSLLLLIIIKRKQTNSLNCLRVNELKMNAKYNKISIVLNEQPILNGRLLVLCCC